LDNLLPTISTSPKPAPAAYAVAASSIGIKAITIAVFIAFSPDMFIILIFYYTLEVKKPFGEKRN
jgi:hypothetical protein